MIRKRSSHSPTVALSVTERHWRTVAHTSFTEIMLGPGSGDTDKRADEAQDAGGLDQSTLSMCSLQFGQLGECTSDPFVGRSVLSLRHGMVLVMRARLG
jgi:hypothetical protein